MTVELNYKAQFAAFKQGFSAFLKPFANADKFAVFFVLGMGKIKKIPFAKWRNFYQYL